MRPSKKQGHDNTGKDEDEDRFLSPVVVMRDAIMATLHDPEIVRDAEADVDRLSKNRPWPGGGGDEVAANLTSDSPTPCSTFTSKEGSRMGDIDRNDSVPYAGEKSIGSYDDAHSVNWREALTYVPWLYQHADDGDAALQTSKQKYFSSGVDCAKEGEGGTMNCRDIDGMGCSWKNRFRNSSQIIYPSWSYLDLRVRQNRTFAKERLAVGISHARRQENAKAESCYKEVLSLVPDHADCLVAYGALLSGGSGDGISGGADVDSEVGGGKRCRYEEAVRMFDKALKADPHCGNARKFRDIVLQKMRRREEKLSVSVDSAVGVVSLPMEQDTSSAVGRLRAQRALSDVMAERALASLHGDQPRGSSIDVQGSPQTNKNEHSLVSAEGKGGEERPPVADNKSRSHRTHKRHRKSGKERSRSRSRSRSRKRESGRHHSRRKRKKKTRKYRRRSSRGSEQGEEEAGGQYRRTGRKQRPSSHNSQITSRHRGCSHRKQERRRYRDLSSSASSLSSLNGHSTTRERQGGRDAKGIAPAHFSKSAGDSDGKGSVSNERKNTSPVPHASGRRYKNDGRLKNRKKGKPKEQTRRSKRRRRREDHNKQQSASSYASSSFSHTDSTSG